tara:strand:+ start:6256 stop:6570 length:315 start_codon:yes stop_codon:yes gene_type:complete
MSLKDAQNQVDEWTSQFKIQYWKPHEITARLMEETGELAREINHIYGPKKKKSTEELRELGDEMADIIFTLCCMANSHKIDLDKHFSRTMDKCYGRDNERYEKR